jgi:hypothetical protein
MTLRPELLTRSEDRTDSVSEALCGECVVSFSCGGYGSAAAISATRDVIRWAWERSVS